MLEEKIQYMENYINDIEKQLKTSGIIIATEQLEEMYSKYSTTMISTDEIIQEIDKTIKDYSPEDKNIDQSTMFHNLKKTISSQTDQGTITLQGTVLILGFLLLFLGIMINFLI